MNNYFAIMQNGQFVSLSRKAGFPAGLDIKEILS